MKKVSVLLLKPTGGYPAAEDQFAGASLASAHALPGCLMTLAQDTFRHGDLEDLQRAVRRRAGKICGVVGATGVLESAVLGEQAEELDLLCFVSNNNPSVRGRRSHIFHIGVPTDRIGSGIAERLLQAAGVKRLYILHDLTEFQSRLAAATARFLKSSGGHVRSYPGAQADWLDDVWSWNPDLIYVVYSNASLALKLVQELRKEVPGVPLLVGMSLLRQSFFSALGQEAEGLLLVDILHRGAAKSEQEKIFMKVLKRRGPKIPNPNHGFGWDAMTLCGLALKETHGEVSSAIGYLESGVELEGTTGYYRFSKEDHNGRAIFNPVRLGRFRNGRVEDYEGGRK